MNAIARMPRHVAGYLLGAFVILLISLALVIANGRPAAGATEAAPAVQSARGAALNAQTLYGRLLDSVVRIETERNMPEGRPNVPGWPDLEDMLPDFEIPDPAPVAGRGTGFVFNDQGHIITNHHVIAGAEDIHVVFADGAWHAAEVVGQDAFSDLAVLRIPDLERAVAPLTLAAGDALAIGETVFAFGYPDSLQGTLTQGIVSSLEPMSGGFRRQGYMIPNLIQSDILVIPGLSGGPLLNAQGEVVGINMGINLTRAGTRGLTNSIPVELVRRIAPTLVQGQEYVYPFLGVGGGSLTVEQASDLELDNLKGGAYISSVQPESAAANGELQAGDIVTAIDGFAIRDFQELAARLILRHAPGDAISVSVLREGQTLDLNVVLDERQRSQS